MNKNNLRIDVLKLNHFLNARKITKKQIFVKNKSLHKKIVLNKDFIANSKEIDFLNKISIPLEKIQFKEKLPDFIYWNSYKIKKTKRPINRDGIHFYNYYSLPNPPEFIGPVILDILCPKNIMPKLNNGHLEQAITVNLGPSDIFGRWGLKKNRVNFAKMRFNSSKKNSWIIGDTYIEPAYCPHSYSRAEDVGSQILSYTAKSPIEKFVKSLNNSSRETYENLIKELKKDKILTALLSFYLKNRGISLGYLSKLYKQKISNLNQVLKNKKLLKKTCKLLSIDHNIFFKNDYNEDSIGKTYMSFKDSFKTIRKFKSYHVASMASTSRYPDLYGLFIKVKNSNPVKDFLDYTCSHYLVTQGTMNFYINNKKILIQKGDAIWISSLKKHGFSGNGALMKLVNGENIDTNDLTQISKLYKPINTLVRSYKDEKSWGYD